MKMPNKAQLEAARAKYPEGTRVELPSGMDDEYSPIPAGYARHGGGGGRYAEPDDRLG